MAVIGFGVEDPHQSSSKYPVSESQKRTLWPAPPASCSARLGAAGGVLLATGFPFVSLLLRRSLMYRFCSSKVISLALRTESIPKLAHHLHGIKGFLTLLHNLCSCGVLISSSG